MKKKILYLTDIGIFGGAEKYFLELLEGMTSRDYASQVCLFPRHPSPGLEKFSITLDKMSVPFSIGPSLPTQASLSQKLGLRMDYLRSFEADLLHVNQGGPKGSRLEMQAARSLHIPIVATSHLPTIDAGDYRFWKAKINNLAQERLLPFHADRYIVVSAINKTLLSKNYHVPLERIHVVHNGIASEKFQRKRNHEILYQYGIRPEHFVIGSVGGLNRRKAQHILIRAAAELCRTGIPDPVRFVLVGEGERREELRALIERHELGHRFFLTGQIEHSLIPHVLSRFDLYTMSSDIEGQPYAMLEAMSAGLAVVSTDVDGVVDIIEDGQNGFLAPKGDAKALAQKLHQLINDDELRREIGFHAYQSIDRRYAMDTMLDKTEAIYRGLWYATQLRHKPIRNFIGHALLPLVEKSLSIYHKGQQILTRQ